MERCRVHITGASGTGTTSLGRALADRWSVPHADTDDYFWEPTVPPYTTKRDAAARLELMEAIFVPRDAWVLTGSLISWGDALVLHFDAVIFLTLDSSLRLERLAQRERRRYGAAVDPGGDREQAFADFMRWAGSYDDPDFDGRSRAGHEKWLASLGCPVLRLDSSKPLGELVEEVESWEPAP